jgi:hypothetical protein
VVEAARTVSKALKQSGFPLKLSTLDLDWQIVFMESDPPASQVPSYLISGCHPAWMVPPASIYVVAERVAGGCGGGVKSSQGVADAELSLVLVHELGHAVEHQLLGDLVTLDRMRAEGFASWFEQNAAGYSPLIASLNPQQEHRIRANEAMHATSGPFQFQGSAHDYSRASMYFVAIVKRYGISGLMDVYQEMVTHKISFFDAVKKRLGWSREKFEEEVGKVAR